MSSESGQGGDRRSWWDKPDPDDQSSPRDPYASDAETTAVPADAGDPYRQAPTQSVPQYSAPAREPASGPAADHGWSSPQEQAHPPQWGGPAPQQEYPPLSGTTPQAGQQPPAQQYGQPQHEQSQQGGYGQGGYGQGPNRTYAETAGQYATPVAGQAHGVLWTAVGGLLFIGSGLGWIAAIVALALTPKARRSILESRGTRSGLGYLLAGKIIAWVTIGLTVLGILALALFFGVLLAGHSTSSDYWYNTVSHDSIDVLATVTGA